MARFDDLNKLKKYIGHQYGLTDKEMSGGNIYTVDQQLSEAAKIFKGILESEIADYYNSYTPKQYKRTGLFLKSVYINGRPYTSDDGLRKINVSFNEFATHPSLFGGEEGFVPMLLSLGWTWKNPDNRYHLSWYSFPQPPMHPGRMGLRGHPFLENAVKKFRRMYENKEINIEVLYMENGRIFKVL